MENEVAKQEEYSNEELLMLYRNTKNKRYLDELYIQIQKMIYHTCNKYGKNLMSYANLEIDDLVSTANFAVTRAIRDYSFEKKVKFSTLACKYVISELQHMYRDYARRNKEAYLDGILVNKTRRSNDDNLVSFTDMLEDVTADTEDKVLKILYLEEILPKLQYAIDSLSDKNKIIFREGIINEKSNEEVGKAAHIATTSVTRSKQRVLVLLRQLIQNPNYAQESKDPNKYYGSVKDIPGNYKDYLYVLKDKEKKVLLLRVEEKKSLKEIGEELEIAASSVGSILQRVSNKLKYASLGTKTKVKPNVLYKKLYDKYDSYISELKERDQKFLRMKYKDNIPYSKIAEIMNMKVTTVSGNVRNAENRFGNLLLKRGIIESLN